MRVHHLNCISACPLGGRLMDNGPEGILERGELTNHCLLIETGKELILVDTGFGLEEVRNPHSRLSEFFLTLNSPDFREDMTAIRQIERLGFDPKDVRHIILTHLDFDHAGGLDDFPWAKVHLLQAERDYAFLQKTWLDCQRFRPQQWSTKNNWQVYEPMEGDSWFGMEKIQAINGISEDICLIPLIGHTHGHAGVAVKSEGKWLFLTGDAYFYHGEMEVHHHCTPGLAFYQTMMEKDRKNRLFNQERLRDLKHKHAGEIELFCSHDVKEFEKLAGRSAGLPVSELSVERLLHIRNHRPDSFHNSL